MVSVENIISKASVLALIAFSLTACDSYKEPKTDEEWRIFCEAPNSFERIKAIPNEAKRQRAGSACSRAPWQKFVPSQPRKW